MDPNQRPNQYLSPPPVRPTSPPLPPQSPELPEQPAPFVPPMPPQQTFPPPVPARPKRKKRLIIIIAVVMLVVVAGVAAFILTKKDSTGNAGQSNSTGNNKVIETSAYKLTVPSNTAVENTSSQASEGSILLQYDQAYGRIKLELFSSSLPQGTTTYTGKVERTDVEIGGIKTERIDQDTRDGYPFPGTPTIGYTIRFENIQTAGQTGDEHHIFSASLLTSSRPGDDIVGAFNNEMNALIDSVEFK